MYHLKLNKIKHLSSNLLYHRITKSFYNGTSNVSANVSNKDCVRLAFIYGMCGTFTSWLDMNYSDKILVFKWSQPTPERFVFFAWCWAIAGIMSWRVLWTKPDTLIRAATSRIRYGLVYGTQTTTLALGVSFGTLAFWSIYYDINEYRDMKMEYQQSINDKHSKLLTHNISQNNNINIIEEKINNNDENTVDINNINDENGVQIINNAIDNNKVNKNQNKKEKEIIQPQFQYEKILNNMYEPCKLFFISAAPIWIISGGLTGIIATRLLTNSVLLNPINVSTAASIAFLTIKRDNHCYDLLDDDVDNVNDIDNN